MSKCASSLLGLRGTRRVQGVRPMIDSSTCVARSRERLTGAVGLDAPADRGDGGGAVLVPPGGAATVVRRGAAGGRGCVRRAELRSQPLPRAEGARCARVARALLEGRYGHVGVQGSAAP